MPGITEPAVDQYMLSLLPARDSVLQEMEAQALQRDIPIVGPATNMLCRDLPSPAGMPVPPGTVGSSIRADSLIGNRQLASH